MAATPFGNFQSEIYLRGTTGERPPFTTDLARLEDAAREAMTPEAFGYVAGSAGSGATARANRRAFDRRRIVPRMLRDVAERDLATSVLGTDMPAPVLLVRERTSLPIVVKGVLHPDDARAALDAGVDGLVVSNHGGRQVDGAVASLDALPAMVEAVGGAVPVLVDSGVRTGADVVKAISLGAAAVLYGRPYIYGWARTCWRPPPSEAMIPVHGNQPARADRHVG